jgi:hypothetical protein
MKHVVHVSGGLCSFWAAHRVIQQYGKENVTLLFCDTLMEDEDLYRFNREAQQFLGLPFVVLSKGITPWDVFRNHKMIGSSRVDMCSRELKRDLLDGWRKTNTTPETHTFYLGLDWTEEHRMIGKRGKPGMIEIFKPWTVKAPMMDEPLWDKCRMGRELEAIGIKRPRLYDMGFPHNNCGGFCVKAGHAHFAHLFRMMPERYAYHEKKEEEMRALVGDYSILRDRRGGKPKAFPLKKLRQIIEADLRDYDTDDWGGCGCSVEFQEVI